jgi:uncharacterized membrane protein
VSTTSRAQARRIDPRINGLIFLFLILVIPLAFFLNIWADEASTLYSTQNGILETLRHAADNEKQAPVYFWIISVWRTLNGSIFFARLFSVICAAAAIKLFAGLASRILDPRPALLATAFFMFHPFFIWASLEIRVYSLVILLSVLVVRLFIDWFWDDDAERSLLQMTLFGVVCIAAIYTNYYLGFLLAGCFAALIVARKWNAAGRYAITMAAVGFAFLPWAYVINKQLAANTSGYQPARDLFDGLQKLWRHALTFILPAGVFPYGDGSPILVARVWIVRAALSVLAVFAVFRRKQISSMTIGLISITAVIFAGLLAAYFILGPVYVEVRHASVLFAPLVLSLASLISDVFEKPAPAWVVLPLAAGVLISFAYSISTLYPEMTKRGDWARVGAFIEQNESSGQPIVVFTTFDALALPYHYHGRNRVLPDERYFDFEQEAEFGTPDSLKGQTDFVISEIPPDAEEFWLVVNEKCMTTDACVPLQNFATANYTIEKEQEFYLEKVFLLRKKH